MSNNTIINYSREEIRMVEWPIGVEYGQDVGRAEEVIRQIIQQDGRIQQEPAPVVYLHDLGDSSVNLVVRVWVKNGDYWSVLFDGNRKIYDEFNQLGISFPFPQLTVHQAKD